MSKSVTQKAAAPVRPDLDAELNNLAMSKESQPLFEAVKAHIEENVAPIVEEFFKLGEIDVPAAARGVATIEKVISSQTIEGPLKLSVYREPEDAEGRCTLDIRTAVTSQINVPIGRTELKFVLLDSEESTLEENSETTAWRSRSGGLISGSFSYMRKAQLRGAKLRATLAVFREVHAATITAKSTPSKD